MQHIMRVRPGELQALTASMRQARRGIQDELDELERQLLALSRSWDGRAERAFAHARREWSDALGRMNAALAEAATTASDAGDRYRETQSAVTALW